MKTRIIFMLFIALFTFAGVGSSNAAVIQKIKTNSTKVTVTPDQQNAQVYQQGRHRWHRMHRRHAHERIRRHHMRHEHHRENRHNRRY